MTMRTPGGPRGSRSLTKDEPLHVRLMSDLKRRLEDGEWAVASQLPTETALAGDYGVSRPTVRMAIKLLEAQGLVHTRHGAGTFVTAFGATMSAGLQELRSTTETIRMQGFEPSVECRTVERRTVTAECAEAFSVPEDSTVVYLERSISADGRIVAFSYEEILDHAISGPLAPERFSGSLFTVLDRDMGYVPAYATTGIEAVYDDGVGWGDGRPERPLYLLFRQAHFTRAGDPTVYSRNYFVEGAFKWTVMRTS